jgi:serine protease Do
MNIDTSNVTNSEEFESEDYEELRNDDEDIYEKRKALQKSKLFYFNEYEDLIEFSSEAIKITCKLIDTSIALHGSNSNWLKCKVIKLAEDTEIDLAILQLETETLPEEVENIVDLDNSVENDSDIKPGSEAILIGYPLGMELAKSKKGDLKVQIYDGKISRESDGIKLQYSTTSTHGASGSPIFNSCGQLIAVNYSGYNFTQGYNFGIVSKHINSLLK